MSDLNCNIGGSNTGQSCVPIMRVQKKIFLVPTFDSTGVANEIDLTQTLNEAYFVARVNDTDASQRWYPLPEMKNIVDERGDSLYQTFEDGSKVFISQGTRTFNGLIVGADAAPQMVGKITSHRGVGMSIFIVDKEKNLIGKVGSSATKLAPIELEADSIDAKFIKTIDTAIQAIQVSFDVHMNEDDADLRMIQSTEMSYDISRLRGLIDVDSTIDNKSTEGFEVTLTTDGGTPITPVLCKGLVIGDFALYNVTDTAPIAITSVTESPAGVYTFVIPTQTSADVLRLTPTKSGYDFTDVIANTITIP